MTSLADLENLWATWPPQTSNALKATVYVERCKIVLQAALDSATSHPLFSNGRVSRHRLAKAIGCGPATISQNKSVRALIESTDRRLACRHIPASSVAVQSSIDFLCAEASPARLPLNSALSRLVLTDDEFIVGGTGYPGIPTILVAGGIHEASADWFRHLVVNDGVATSSAVQYAKTIRPYLAFCRRRRRDWESADDHWLLEWRSFLLKVRHVSKRQANYSLSVIFQFYVFCEEHRLLRYRVGCHDRSALPAAMREVRFPLTATRVFAGRNKSATWVTPLLYRNVESSIGKRGTPTEAQLEAAHRQALRGGNPARDTLLMRLAEDTGGRRVEILQLTVKDIPDMRDVDDLADQEDAWWPLEVVRKGGHKEILRAQPDTLYAIHAYLRERRRLVQHFVKVRPGYKEPDALFLSSTNGEALQADSVTALVKKFFRGAGVDLVNIHRSRAKFAVDAVESVLDAFLDQGVEFAPGSNWVETVLQQVAIRMGHKNPSSLRHYLTVALERRVRVSHAAAHQLKVKGERNAMLAAETITRKAKLSALLLGDLDGTSDPRGLAVSLRELASELEKQVDHA